MKLVINSYLSYGFYYGDKIPQAMASWGERGLFHYDRHHSLSTKEFRSSHQARNLEAGTEAESIVTVVDSP